MLEQNKTSEARRKDQRNGEEDPVIVAQRFLNIYRQLHIFSAEKKEAFNKMLLALPVDIRSLFSSLPGGAILQDYVDELAEKAGIEKSARLKETKDIDAADDEVSKAKILATALAEAQIQAATKLQAPISQQTISPTTYSSASQNITNNPSMDKNFAQEFAVVLANALQKSNSEQRDEIKNIINTLGQTQLEIVKVLQSENNERREDMKTIAKMLSESQNKIAAMGVETNKDGYERQISQPKISEETKHLIRMLLESQQQIVTRLAKVEATQNNNSSSLEVTKEFNKAQENFSKILNVISERQKTDTLEIAKLINTSQQRLVQMMIQQNNSGNASANNNNANNIQINTVDYTPQINMIVDKIASIQAANNNNLENMVNSLMSAQSQFYRTSIKEQTRELSSVIAMAIKESQEISTQNIIEAMAQKPVVINNPLPINDEILQKQNYEDNNYHEKEFSSENLLEKNINTVSVVAEKKKKKKKKKNKKDPIGSVLDEGFIRVADDNVSSANDDIFQKETSNNDKFINSETANFKGSYDGDFSEESPINNAEEDLPITISKENFKNEKDESGKIQDQDIVIENSDNENFSSEENNSWIFNETNDISSQTDNVLSEYSYDIQDDWGFGTSDSNNNIEENKNSKEQDWEWAYVEEANSQDVYFNNDNLQPIDKNSYICSGNLFFQNAVNEPISFKSGNFIQPTINNSLIKDSAQNDIKQDPYKNSILQD